LKAANEDGQLNIAKAPFLSWGGSFAAAPRYDNGSGVIARAVKLDPILPFS
jgi:hypothetical protein